MDFLNQVAIGVPLLIVALVAVGFYKAFIKKKNVTASYTPFDEITGQTPIAFHEEHEVIALDEKQSDAK